MSSRNHYFLTKILKVVFGVNAGVFVVVEVVFLGVNIGAFGVFGVVKVTFFDVNKSSFVVVGVVFLGVNAAVLGVVLVVFDGVNVGSFDVVIAKCNGVYAVENLQDLSQRFFA